MGVAQYDTMKYIQATGTPDLFTTVHELEIDLADFSY